MTYKLNISEKGKAWKLELESETLAGRKLGDKFEGKEISPDFSGYELEITGATDFSGFPHKKEVEGSELRKVILKKGWGMHAKKKGLKKRKTIRGNQISDKTTQINLSVLKVGDKSLLEIFPDQNKAKEDEKKVEEVKKEGKEEKMTEDEEVKEKIEEKKEESKEKPEEEVKEEIAEEIAEEVKEEIKEDIPSSPETETEGEKEEAAEKIAEEVAEEIKEEITKEEVK